MTTESITQDYVKQLFKYRDGELYWKNSPAHSVRIGQKAGTLKPTGYYQIKIKEKKYLNHRLIFLMYHGYLPKILDHIDGNRANNKIENLREVTLVQNQHNRKINKNNSSGVKGVSWRKLVNKWEVKICVNNKRKHLGFFADLELAELVAQEARNKYHGSFANHG
jgi:hypothetical protein